uniref:Uncharacterized protein n=1 Tax=Marmota marmota marmota TaxID=9994 RepID=A0A8C5Z272_MARMA
MLERKKDGREGGKNWSAWVKEEPKRRLARLLAKPAPDKSDTKPRKVVGKAKYSDKYIQTKEKRIAKRIQAEVANQETKEDLPAENGEFENEESPASDEAEEKEAKSVNNMPCLFYQLFCKSKFFSCSKNISKKEGIPSHLLTFFF